MQTKNSTPSAAREEGRKIKASRQPKLSRAVIRQLGGTERLADISACGASGGYPGFIYHAETVEFTRRNRTAILERMKENAESIGCGGIISMLADFGCLKGFSEEEIAAGLYSPKSAARVQIYNAMAWYAAEEIARELTAD